MLALPKCRDAHEQRQAKPFRFYHACPLAEMARNEVETLSTRIKSGWPKRGGKGESWEGQPGVVGAFRIARQALRHHPPSEDRPVSSEYGQDLREVQEHSSESKRSPSAQFPGVKGLS